MIHTYNALRISPLGPYTIYVDQILKIFDPLPTPQTSLLHKLMNQNRHLANPPPCLSTQFVYGSFQRNMPNSLNFHPPVVLYMPRSSWKFPVSMIFDETNSSKRFVLDDVRKLGTRKNGTVFYKDISVMGPRQKTSQHRPRIYKTDVVFKII